MNTFIVNKNSFHYKFNKFIKTTFKGVPSRVFEYCLPADFCSYWRMTAFNVLFTLLVSMFFGMIGIIIGHQFIVDPIGASLAFASVIVVIAIFCGTIMGIYYIKDYTKNKLQNKPDGIIRTKYKSWKSKYCPMIEYKD